MAETTVEQRRRSKGWRKPEGSVCVDRTTRWGNWWLVVADDSGERDGWWVMHDDDAGDDTWFPSIDAARAAAADRYRADVHAAADDRARWILDHAPELTGKTLLCWCPQPGPCHAHVLAEMADLRSAELDSGGELER